MKKIFYLLAIVILASVQLNAQIRLHQYNSTPFEFNDMWIRNVLRPPQDTTAQADSGSIAIKNGIPYVKWGHWYPLNSSLASGIHKAYAGNGLINVNDSTLRIDSLLYGTIKNRDKLRDSTFSVLLALLAGKQATGNYITSSTGDVLMTGPGAAAATLATTGVIPGSYSIPNITVDAKGRITAISTGPVVPAQFNPIAGTNITITGSYPNMTINSLGGGSGSGILYYNSPLYAPNDSTLGVLTVPGSTGPLLLTTQHYVDSLHAIGGAGITALTNDVVASGTGSVAATIANDAVTYAKMQNISATNRFLGRITSGAGNTEELTGTQATSLLDVVTSSLKGLVPAPGTATGRFLKDNLTWGTPAGGGTIDGSGGDTQVAFFNGTTFTLASSTNFTWNGTQLLVSGSGSNSSLRTGAIELQSLGANNGFISDNLYFDGSVTKRRSSGYGVLSYFTGGRYLIQTATSSTAGSTATMANRFIIANDGDFSLGGNATSASDYSGSYINAITGKVSVLTNSPDSGFTVNSNSHIIGDLTVNDEAYDATAWNGSVEVPTKNAVRDKIESLGSSFSNPLTTTGDIIVSLSGSTPSRLGIGSANQVLTVISGVPSWQTPSSGSGTINSGVTGKPAYYTASTTVDDYSFIDYATSGRLATITGAASDTLLSLRMPASPTGNYLNILGVANTIIDEITRNGSLIIGGGDNDARHVNGIVIGYNTGGDYGVIKSVSTAGGNKDLYIQAGNLKFADASGDNAVISSLHMRIGGSAAPNAGLNLPASVSGFASLNIPNGTPPGSPNDGDIWRASNFVKVYNGSAIRRFTATNDATPSNGQLPMGNGTDFTIGTIASADASIGIALSSGGIDLSVPTNILDVGDWTSGTPTATVNIAAIVRTTMHYIRVKNGITGYGEIEVDPTSTGNTEFELDLPFASTFANNRVLAGNGFAIGIQQGLTIQSDVSTNKALFKFNATDVSNQVYRFTFSYLLTPP